MTTLEQVPVAQVEAAVDLTPNFNLLKQCPDTTMFPVIKLITQGAKAKVNLIYGETGTGKELVARALHEKSSRAKEPFIVVNCAALPENLIESLLFGHEKGSFTGAHTQRRGVFEQAGEGTVFLDEIGELPLQLQPRFLRATNADSLTRVGGDEEIKPKCKIVAATHRDLEDLVEKDKFREDLYHRLSVFTITVPSLRERMGDIMYLANYFVNKVSGGAVTLADECADVLVGRTWTGNVRELAHSMERAWLMLDEGENKILPSHLRLKQEKLSTLNLVIANLDLSQHGATLYELVKNNGGLNNFRNKVLAAIYNTMSARRGGEILDGDLATGLGMTRQNLLDIRRRLKF